MNQAWLDVGDTLGGGVQDFGALVATITRRRALDLLRQRRRRLARETDLAAWQQTALESSADPEAQTAARDALAAIVGCRRLGKDESKAFLLRVLSGLRYEEIGRAMGRPVNSVSVLIHRARKKLKEDPEVQRLLLGAVILACWLVLGGGAL